MRECFIHMKWTRMQTGKRRASVDLYAENRKLAAAELVTKCQWSEYVLLQRMANKLQNTELLMGPEKMSAVE